MGTTIYSNDNFRRNALLTLDHFTGDMRESERLLRNAMETVLSTLNEIYGRLELLADFQEVTMSEYRYLENADDTDSIRQRAVFYDQSVQLRRETDLTIDKIWETSSA